MRKFLLIVFMAFSASSAAEENCGTPKINAYAAERIVLANIKGYLEAVEIAEGKFPVRFQYNLETLKIDKETPCFWYVGIDRVRKASHMHDQYKVSKESGEVSIVPRR